MHPQALAIQSFSLDALQIVWRTRISDFMLHDCDNQRDKQDDRKEQRRPRRFGFWLIEVSLEVASNAAIDTILMPHERELAALWTFACKA